MVAGDVEPFRQIKPVCAKSLHTGVQMELGAAFLDRLLNQPIEERRAISFGAVGLAGDKVVHIKELPPREAFGDAIASHGHHFSFDLKKRQLVAPRHLAFDLLEESGA